MGAGFGDFLGSSQLGLGAGSEFQTDLPPGDGMEQFGSVASTNRCVPRCCLVFQPASLSTVGSFLSEVLPLNWGEPFRPTLVSQNIGTPLLSQEVLSSQRGLPPAPCPEARGVEGTAALRLATWQGGEVALLGSWKWEDGGGGGGYVAAEGKKVLGAEEEEREKLPRPAPPPSGSEPEELKGSQSQQASPGAQRGGPGWHTSGKRPALWREPQGHAQWGPCWLLSSQGNRQADG